MLFKIELKHSETLWPVQFKEKKYPEVLQVSGLGNARTLTQTFPRLKDFYICYWPITWHLVSFLNNLDVVINNSSRFMQQQSIYLGKQSLKNRSPPTQYDTNTTLIASSSFPLVTSYQPFHQTLMKGPLKKMLACQWKLASWEKKRILAVHTALPAHVMVLLDWRRAKELQYGVNQSPILAGALVSAVSRGGEKKEPCRRRAFPGTCWVHSQVGSCI